MAREIHYEIFARQGSRGGWRMIEVRSERDSALDLARELMADGRATGVKVVKETFNDDSGEYLTLKIFEDGHNQFKTLPAQEDMPNALPCFKPDDLYSYHARATITRLLSDYLARNKLTVTELGHRADALEKFEATGTVLQHAIQRVAVAQAASTTTPVQQIVKRLLELTNQAMQRVYRDSRKGVFVRIEAEGFNALAAKLANQPDGGYLLNGALALYLREAKGWDDKLVRLLTVIERADGDGKALLLASIDAIVAEVLSGSAALHELIGPRENFGGQLSSLVDLFLGIEPQGERAGLIALTKHFAADDLPEARTAIAARLMAEFKSVKRLAPASLFEEFQTLRRIADRLVRGIGKYLSHEDLVAAVTLRSKRLVTHETLGEHIADAASPEEKLSRLMFVEENIVGAENKRKLATFIVPLITAPFFESHFQNQKVPVLSRLKALAALQLRVRRSGLQEDQRREIECLLDKLGCEVEARSKVLETLIANAAGPVERARALLTLCTGEVLTEGRLAAKARELVLAQLAKPGFLTGYTAQARCDAQAAVGELMDLLGKAGISAETGLKSIAA